MVTGQNLQDDRTPEELIAEAVKVAADADYVIFIGGLNKSNNQDCEDTDRAGLELPYGQDAVISALAKANKNLVVINVSGNAVAGLRKFLLFCKLGSWDRKPEIQSLPC